MSENVLHLFKDTTEQPELTVVTDLPTTPAPSGRWVAGVLHHARRYRYGWSAIRAAYIAASVPLVGTGRMAGTAWGWLRADDYANARDESPEFVEKVRTRRRRTAWVCTGVAATILSLSWWLISPDTPLYAGVGTLAAGTVLETRRRLAERSTPLRFPGLGKRTPGENAVTRAAVASKLGTGQAVEEMRLAAPILNEGTGWSTVLQLPPGQRARKAMGKEADFASALGVGETQVVFDLVTEHAGRLAVYVSKDDPFAIVYPSPLLGRTEPVDFWAGVPAGVNGRGRAETLRLVDASLLVAGEPRAGKSAAVNGIIGAAALAVTPRIHLWDGKGAGDHRPWRRIAHTAEKRNAPGLLAHLKRMQKRMEDVFDMLDDAQAGSKLTPALCRQLGVDVELTVVDETRYYVTSPQGTEIVDTMVDIASRGPAAGVLLVLATQRMTADAIPGPLKGVCSLRWAMRCPDSIASNAVLGPGAVGRGYDASDIPRSHRGVGILDADGAEPVKLRSYFLNDQGEDLQSVAEAAYTLREAAGTLPERETRERADDGQLRAVLGAFGSDVKLHRDTLAERLGWTAEQLTTALDGVPVRQVWRDGANRRGYVREDVEAAL